MDRLTKFAAKLYPRWWRERYGEEFAALLEDARPGLGGCLDILKEALRMRLTGTTTKTILVSCVAGVLCGLGATFLLAPSYSSKAVLTLRSPTGSAEAKGVVGTVLTRGRLAQMVRDFDLYANERQRMPLEDLLEFMRRNIRVSPSSVIVERRTVPAFEVSFEYPDKVKAQRVVTALVSGFIDANLEQGEFTMEVLDPASLPTDPVYPRKKTFATIGLAGGLLVGGVAALVLHFRRKRASA